MDISQRVLNHPYLRTNKKKQIFKVPALFKTLLCYLNLKKLLPLGSLWPVLVTAGEVPLWWSSDSPVLLAPVTHHFAVDSTGNTIVQLCVQLGQDIFYTKQSFNLPTWTLMG